LKAAPEAEDAQSHTRNLLRVKLFAFALALGQSWRNVAVMGRVPRERESAEHQRRVTQIEQGRVDPRDEDTPAQFRAMRTHERAAELHDAIAALLPPAD
jgi:hypothetical protein